MSQTAVAQTKVAQTTVAQLAELVAGDVVGDGRIVVTGAQALEKAGSQDVTFAEDARNIKKLAGCTAGAVIVPRDLADSLPPAADGRALILVDQPQSQFLRIVAFFRPLPGRLPAGHSPSAVISATATIGQNTHIAPFAVIAADVVIGDNCDIHAGVSIGPGCRLGNDITLHANVVLYHDVEIADRVSLHSSTVIGADGFGYRMVEGRHQKVPHFGTVRIEEDVEIGACSTVDRAMIGETVIGRGTKIDNHVIVAHNCEIGQHNILVAQVGLAGSVTTGDYVICSGQVAVSDHLHLGEKCVIGPQSGITKNVPAGATYIGSPAQDAAAEIKVLMAARKLPAMRKKMRALETKMTAMAAQIEALSPQTGPATNDETSQQAA